MKFFKFTLIEVVIATLILALSATVAVEMTSRAHLGAFNAEEEWNREHLLAVACEYYLLFGHDADEPDFLAEGYSASCTIEEGIIPEEDDEEKYDASSGWVIGEYTIRLFKDGEEQATISIDKLVPADAFE